jgi:predicted transcriptional regulator
MLDKESLVYKAAIKIKDLNALGLYIYLLTIPSDEKISRTKIKAYFNLSENKMDNYMRYLIKNGYVKYTQKRLETGRLTEGSIEVVRDIL